MDPTFESSLIRFVKIFKRNGIVPLDIEAYHRRRQQFIDSQTKYRDLCVKCLQPLFGCYCKDIQKIDPKIKFVILTHPIEVKRRIATGRMAHLGLENSELIRGIDFSKNDRVNALVADPRYQPMVLYPGAHALNISGSESTLMRQIFSPEKALMIFVIDGTWATARPMLNQSKNLIDLPRICFTPLRASQFRVRKQPAEYCLSTIEAIHHTIELLAPLVSFDSSQGEHDKLLSVFHKMVERQLQCVRDSYDNPRPTTYRRPRVRVA
jgi:DTW domain-containing protein